MMFGKYDIKELNEYLGMYAVHLTVSPEEEPLGMYVEGAAKFVKFVEKTIEDEKTNDDN